MMKPEIRVNPFLSGNYAPVRSEDDFIDLPVSGEMPKGLAGTFYRNGPNPQFEPLDDYHWFAGDGMIHAFTVTGGHVIYRNRWVRTSKWALEHAAGKQLFGTFGNPATTDPSVGDSDDGLANTNIIWHAGKLLALEEQHQPFELEPKTLSSKGYLPYAGNELRFTAHPKIDPDTGELVFFAYSAGGDPNRIAYGVVDAGGNVKRLNSFEAPYSSMIHDFFVTKNYVMFPVLPLTYDADRAASGGPFLAWDKSLSSYVGVLKRDADVSTIRWFTTDPCFMFHPMNMFEEGDQIHVDLMQYDRAPLFANADGSHERFAAANLHRWTLNLKDSSNVINRKKIDDSNGEFPRFDERRAGRSYRHGYFPASSNDGKDDQLDEIAHIDFQTGKKTIYRFPVGDVVGETVFVPRHANADEGDGWLVAVVYRGETDTSDFVVFEANDINKGPVGTAHLPRRVPFGFHGNWVPDNAMLS